MRGLWLSYPDGSVITARAATAGSSTAVALPEATDVGPPVTDARTRRSTLGAADRTLGTRPLVLSHPPDTGIRPAARRPPSRWRRSAAPTAAGWSEHGYHRRMSLLKQMALPLLVLVTAIVYWLLTYEPAGSTLLSSSHRPRRHDLGPRPDPRRRRARPPRSIPTGTSAPADGRQGTKKPDTAAALAAEPPTQCPAQRY